MSKVTVDILERAAQVPGFSILGTSPIWAFFVRWLGIFFVGKRYCFLVLDGFLIEMFGRYRCVPCLNKIGTILLSHEITIYQGNQGLGNFVHILIAIDLLYVAI